MSKAVASFRLEHEFGAPAELTPTNYKVARRTDGAWAGTANLSGEVDKQKVGTPQPVKWAWSGKGWSMDGALSAFRLGIGALTGAWRTDPATNIRACRSTEIMGHGEVPAVLDGEPVTLPARVRIVAVPVAARVIALDEAVVAAASSPA